MEMQDPRIRKLIRGYFILSAYDPVRTQIFSTPDGKKAEWENSPPRNGLPAAQAKMSPQSRYSARPPEHQNFPTYAWPPGFPPQRMRATTRKGKEAKIGAPPAVRSCRPRQTWRTEGGLELSGSSHFAQLSLIQFRDRHKPHCQIFPRTTKIRTTMRISPSPPPP